MSNLKVNNTQTQSPNQANELQTPKETVNKQDQNAFEEAMQGGKQGDDQKISKHKISEHKVSEHKDIVSKAMPENAAKLTMDIQKMLIAQAQGQDYEMLKQKTMHAGEKMPAPQPTGQDGDSLQSMLASQQNLMSQMQGGQNTPANTIVVENTASVQNVETIATKLVEHILVSKADTNQQEVRLKVNNDILTDTEIILQRDQGGNLKVTLITDNANSWQTLAQGQHHLKAALNKIEDNTTVMLQSSAENMAENNDSQRRSRTFAEANPDEDRG